MQSANQREDLQPQADPGLMRSYALALLVHLLLAAALTWGVSWKSQNPEASFSAELWSATPQEAAPPLAESPPSPPQAAVEPPPPPAPSAAAQAAAAAQAEAEAEAEIALQKERQRKRQQAETAKKAELAEKLKADKEKADKAKTLALAAAEKAEKDKARKAQEAAVLAKAKASKDADTKQQAKEQAKEEAKQQAAAEKLRQQNIARMVGMAGGTGAPDARGTAAQASGPSDGYAGRVRARIKPNVVFTEDITGNPVAEVEVRTSLDGTIISQRLIKSSGNKAWDDAVIKAIIRTEVLPRDVDGRVPTPLIISFRPKD